MGKHREYKGKLDAIIQLVNVDVSNPTFNVKCNNVNLKLEKVCKNKYILTGQWEFSANIINNEKFEPKIIKGIFIMSGVGYYNKCTGLITANIQAGGELDLVPNFFLMIAEFPCDNNLKEINASITFDGANPQTLGGFMGVGKIKAYKQHNHC